MMAYAVYMPTQTAKQNIVLGERGRKNSVNIIISAMMLTICSVLGLGSLTASTMLHTNTPTAARADGGFDPIRWTMCYFGKGSLPERAYQYANTDALQFALFSKSSISRGLDDVTSGDNWLADLNAPNFKTKNEAVLGRYLYELMDSDTTKYGDAAPATDPKTKPKFNSGPQLNPFDRFGYAGLQFTAYQGEWKYVVLDACHPDKDPVDPKTGLYYDGRMVPQTTWEGLPTTMDIRSMQANKGFLNIELMAYLNTISNIIFSLAKGIVAVTVALIGFSMSDVVKTMGIQSILVGGDGNDGAFTHMFNGIYIPLVSLAFVATALYMFWMGIVKRQIRKALTSFIRSVAMFFAAFIIAAKPGFWMALPNNVAVLLEAVTISALDGSTVGKNSLCTTDVGAYQGANKLSDNAGSVDTTKLGSSNNIDYLTNVSKNMQSVVSCTLWQELLFKPWAQGQFGVDWNQTWAKGKIPSWAPKGAEAFEPNGPHVLSVAGDAAVPMGGGKIINNWALFQLSTETNVHSPLGMDGQPSKVTSGVSNDWWRVVDVVSGYDEKVVKHTYASSQAGADDVEQDVTKPDDTAKPLPSWGTWIGSAAGSRIMVAASAVFVAVIAVIGPLLFALMSAVYSVGIAILMLFSPIMLLFGVWADRGYEIFKAWFDMLINLIIKRVMFGVLMVLSLLFTSTSIGIMQKDGWFKGVLTMIILTAVLVKNRKRIVDAAAKVQLSRFSLAQTGTDVVQRLNNTGKSSRKIGTMALVGGYASKRAGGSITAGVSAGARQEMRNFSRRSEFIQATLRTYNAADVHRRGMNSDEYDNMATCAICRQNLTGNSQVGSLPEGGYICANCMDDGQRSDAVPMTVDFSQARADQEELDRERQGGDARRRLVTDFNPGAATQMDSRESREKIEKIKRSNATEEELLQETAEVASRLEDDIAKTVTQISFNSPKIPDELRMYMDSAVLDVAWQERNYDYIREAYLLAWARWAQVTFGAEWENAMVTIYQSMIDRRDNLDTGEEEE